MFRGIAFIHCLCSLYPDNFSTEAYVEVLDGSRVHPETYEWARKMAVDALEYDDSAEDANPAGALEEILENPERLRDLDLDAFAEELERQVCSRIFFLSNFRTNFCHLHQPCDTIMCYFCAGLRKQTNNTV